MPLSLLRLIKRCAEFHPQERVTQLPSGLRGIYVLYQENPASKRKRKQYSVVYVGMARSSIRGRLRDHSRTKRKGWTHFSVFEVWDNIRDEEVAELEGLFRHIYRRDGEANRLNV